MGWDGQWPKSTSEATLLCNASHVCVESLAILTCAASHVCVERTGQEMVHGPRFFSTDNILHTPTAPCTFQMKIEYMKI